MSEPRKCSCDAFCDAPCPVHARENALQNEVIELRNQVIAREEVLATRRERAKLADERYEALVADRDEWRQQHENARTSWQADLRALDAAKNNALSGEAAAVRRAASAELGCEIAYRREPTQAEGDAHADGADECFVAMGGWTGRRCRACCCWVWGGPTACDRCVGREEREDTGHA